MGVEFRLLGPVEVPGAGITRRSSGYVLTVAPESVDLHRFRRLVADARAGGEVVQQSYPVVLAYFDSDDAQLRRTAAEAAVAHVRTQVLAGERPTVIARLRAWADEPSRDRGFWVLCLGELGDDTQRFLFDPDTDVRVCAALAPSVADVDRATDIVVADSRLCSLDTLIGVALARAGFQRIAGPAVTIVRHTEWTGFDTTWGPLVLAAFRPRCKRRAGLTGVQRDVLTALVDNPRLWDENNGSMGLVFSQAGLPYERETCARLVQS